MKTELWTEMTPSSKGKSNSRGGSEPPDAGSGFGRLAKRLSSWAANLLASGLILIAGLVFGRQVLQWWRAEPERPAEVIEDVVGSAPVVGGEAMPLLEFGDFPVVMRRSEIEGGTDEALAQLRRMCREAAAEVRGTAEVNLPAEQRLLQSLGHLQPIEQLPADGALYQISAPLPMVVAVGTPPGEESAGDGQVVGSRRRVLSWGLGLETAWANDTSPRRWTLFTWSGSGETVPTAARAPVPPSGRRIMSLRSQDGGQLVVLRGRGRPQPWMAFYDESFARQGWRASRSWQQADGIWRRRFESLERESATVQLIADREGSLSALLLFNQVASN